MYTQIMTMYPLLISILHILFIISICQLCRYVSNVLVKHSLARIAIEEFICAVQLCATNFELGVITQIYGFSAYALGLFFCSFTYTFTFQDGTCDPSECYEKFCKREMSAREAVLRATFSIMGAAVSYRFAKIFWSFGLMATHMDFYKNESCDASLQVPVLIGLGFETFETIVNRLLQNMRHYNMLISAISDVCITFFGLFVSGGYFNPTLSFAMEYGCQGLSGPSFFLVYWFGPILGSSISLKIAKPLLRIIEGSDEAKVEVVDAKAHSD
uniref:Aquaporin-11 n=1 Tax=Milnesium tardigradum TaxID=46460 RepID=AQP11_MILTA|nr:RecName: Full=Aquaporin-11; Short=AQP-11 [Milnesium tardigradum]AEP14565.2 aquaporin 11 [Milnesium tardigradum]